MNTNLSQKNIGIAVAAVIVIGGLLWYFFSGSSDTQAPLSGENGSPNPIETQFLTLTGELSPISFDKTIFSDPRFAALVDITMKVTPEQTGRPDPFAPVTLSAAPAIITSGQSTATGTANGGI